MSGYGGHEHHPNRPNQPYGGPPAPGGTPNPYGAPPAPNPYGAPVPPPGAPVPPPGAPPVPPPGAGYPGGPVPQFPPPPPPRRGRGGVVALVVVLVLLVVGGGGALVAYKAGVFGDSGGDRTATAESPRAASLGVGGERTRLWAAPAQDRVKLALTRLIAGDGVIARVMNDTVSGFDAATGRQKWTIKADPGLELCAATPAADHGIGAILFRAGAHDAPCSNAVAIDLVSGRQLWQKSMVPVDADFGARSPAITVAHGVVVTTGATAPIAFDARSGRRLWTGPTLKLRGEARQLDNVAVGADGAVMATYGGDTDDETGLVAVQDPRTGRIRRTFAAPHPRSRSDLGTTTVVVSTDPLVVQMPDPDDNAENRYLARNGSSWTELRQAEVRGASARQQGDGGVVGDGMMVKWYTIDDPKLDVGFDTVVAGFDLRTGHAAWQHRLMRDNSQVTPLGVSGGAARAIVTGNDVDPQLYAFPLRDGTPVRGGPFTTGESGSHASAGSYAAELGGGRVAVFGDGDGVLAVYGPGAKSSSSGG